MEKLRLGVNIDHVATLRNARGAEHPCPVKAAILAAQAGADGITAHLREDRRHIRDRDLFRLKDEVGLPLNMEMAATEEMLKIALQVKPHACCIVPERREELTTEGGLNVNPQALKPIIEPLKQAGIRVSLFIDAKDRQLEAAKVAGADIVEFHTGLYSHGSISALEAIRRSSVRTASLGLECHAGHGLNYENVSAIAAIPEMRELNIGHFLMGEAIYVGLQESIKKMKQLMDEARI